MKLLDIECARDDLRRLLASLPADPTGPHANDVLRARLRIGDLIPDLDRLRAIARAEEMETS